MSPSFAQTQVFSLLGSFCLFCPLFVLLGLCTKGHGKEEIVNSFVCFLLQDAYMLIDIGLFPHALWAQRSCLGSIVVPWPFQHMFIK